MPSECSPSQLGALLCSSAEPVVGTGCADQHQPLAAARGAGVPARLAAASGPPPSAPQPLPVPVAASSVQCYYIIYSFELEDDVCSVLYEFFIKREKQSNLASLEPWWWVMALI